MRKEIYKIVHLYDASKASAIYKFAMIGFIVLSILPLTFKTPLPLFRITDMICLSVFILDYFLRWITADYKFGKHEASSFLFYPIRLISFVDMISIFSLACSSFSLFSQWRMAKIFTVFRIIRIFRYSKSIRTILGILHKSKKPLVAVGSLAVGYILLSAIVMFNVEPGSFRSFFDAVYWSTVSLTTVGYGDIYPVSALGRLVAMVSSFLGIAIVALPAGIVTAEYMNSLKQDTEK